MSNHSLYPPFDERRKRILETDAATPMKVDKLEELINMQLPPSSEDRLDQLPKRKWSPTLFWQATKRLRKDTGMTPYFYRSPAGLPRISRDTSFKYAFSYEDSLSRFERGEKLQLAVISESERVIAFGIAALCTEYAEIEIIDVDEFSRRSAGIKQDLNIAEESFSVGLGHIIVSSLTEEIKTTIKTDATNEASRYIFKSLGFIRASRQTNPCCLFKRCQRGLKA